VSPDAPTIAFLVLTAGVMPIASVALLKRLQSGRPLAPKWRRELGTLAGLLVIGAAAQWTALRHGIELWPRQLPPWMDVFYALLFLGVMLFASLRGLKRAPEERRRHLFLLLPGTKLELSLWLPVSLGAGIAEEMAYRGVLVQLLQRWSHSIALALLGSILLFTLAHMYQGGKAMIGVAYLAAVFHVLVWVSGSLYIAMFVHAAYDLGLGLFLRRAVQGEAGMTQPATAGAQ
jgi:membrane protease YdiL (CAAX protease family)